jgi:AcrR family transcriptional regulator
MSRPLRADAARNRARILSVADELFAAGGPSVSTEEVASAAGVGIGTVFRHFPTKEDLLAAVLRARLEALAAQAEAAAGAADPGTAFGTIFASSVERSPAKLTLARAAGDRAAIADVGERLRAALAVLLRRGQESGQLRRDVTVEDVIALLAGASRAWEQAGDDPARRARTVTVILDGLATKPVQVHRAGIDAQHVPARSAGDRRLPGRGQRPT